MPLWIRRSAVRWARAALRGYARGWPWRHRPPETDRKVSILLMHAWGMGGTIRAVLNLAGHLAQRHEVEVLSVLRRWDEAFFDLPAGVSVTALDDRRAGACPWVWRPMRHVLSRHHTVLMRRPDPAWRFCTMWTDLCVARALRKRQSRVLIGTRPGLNMLALDLASPGLLVVGQEHMHLAAHSRRLRASVRRRYRALAALAVLTRDDLRDYGQLLRDRVRIEHIPNAVAELPGPQADPVATTVVGAGRLTGQKGFDLLIAAFAQVADDHPQWRLRICGDGPARAVLEHRIAEYGLTGRVTLTGAVRNLGEELAAGSVYALSSRFEGFPLVLLEAMSKGLAAVSFDCPTGPREIVEDGRNGLLVPAGDVDGFARALTRVMQDADLRRRLAAEGMRTLERYSMAVIGPRWDALLAEVVERARATASGRVGDSAPPRTPRGGLETRPDLR